MAIAIENISGQLKKVERRAKKAKELYIPNNEAGPVAELRMLVRRHQALIRRAVAFERSVSDVKDKKGVLIRKCDVPSNLREMTLSLCKEFRNEASGLESAITQNLRLIPIYNVFLKHVFGCGPIVSGYLASKLDIHRSVYSSKMRRYCGLAVFNGRLERRAPGLPSGYSAEMRTRVFQVFSSMRRNAAKATCCARHADTRPKKKDFEKKEFAEAMSAWSEQCHGCGDCLATEFPFGGTTKYLDVWNNYKARAQNSERFDLDGNTRIDFNGVEQPGAKSFIHATGWHKAADIFLQDLYQVWRALEGLPVWPTYVEAKLRQQHGGIPLKELGPTNLTVDEALARVGFVGRVPLRAPTALFTESEEEALTSIGDELESEAADD